MTFTVDDLVASFNSGGHIGQEAIDIADLQAQLAQTLAYAQQQQQQQLASSTHRLCNTPTTARTPTTSLGNWSAFEQQHHRSRSRSASIVADGGGMDTVNEDSEMEMETDEELAVEQLLVPSHSQAQASTRRRTRGDSICTHQQHHNCAHTQIHPSQNQVRYSQTGADSISVSESVSPLSSSYAASDPFFAAATAESVRQNQQGQSSFFAQIGRPSQQSPFFAAAQANSGNATPQNQFTSSPWCVPAGTVDS